MKHLKQFEEINYVNDDEDLVNPHMNDYVLCEENFGDNDKMNFINNNIGQIIVCTYEKNNYLVKFENVPRKISNFFNEKQPNCRNMSRAEILNWSKDKQELETLLASKKYNI